MIRFYAASFGRRPTLREFLSDTQEVGRGVVFGQPGADQLLEANRVAFANNWVTRTGFQTQYNALSNTDYVNTLMTNGGAAAGDETTLRTQLINGLNANPATETRATALRKVCDSKTVFNKQYNAAFVLLQYIGYLRRDPDTGGFNFWLSKMNGSTQAGEDATNPDVALLRVTRAQMVEAFIDSDEYRQRFGPNVR